MPGRRRSPSSSIAPSRGSAGADTARPTTLEPTTAAETRAGSADRSPAAIRSCAQAGSAGATTRGCNASRAQVSTSTDGRIVGVPAISSADAGINPEAGTIGFHHPRSTASLTSRGIEAQRARSATSSAARWNAACSGSRSSSAIAPSSKVSGSGTCPYRVASAVHRSRHSPGIDVGTSRCAPASQVRDQVRGTTRYAS